MADTALHETQESPAAGKRWWQRPEVRAIFIIWLILTIIGEALAWVPAWLMGTSASEQMDEIKQTMTAFTAFAAPVATLVWAAMIYSLAKWRYKGDTPPPDDAPGFTTNTPSIMLWVIASGVLTMIVFIWGLLKIAAIPAAGALALTSTNAGPPIEIQVTGNQWVWNFTYPELGNIQSDVLYLPVDRTAVFNVTSVDVIHSFWIVEMGVKVDANPGEIAKTQVLSHSLGTYDVRCAELCGLFHGAMETQAKVVTQAEFDTWAADQGSVVSVGPVAAEGGE